MIRLIKEFFPELLSSIDWGTYIILLILNIPIFCIVGAKLFPKQYEFIDMLFGSPKKEEKNKGQKQSREDKVNEKKVALFVVIYVFLILGEYFSLKYLGIVD